ncbi:MAG: ATP-binding protein [Minwuia sp.]|uniref:ATP-binding protein n=1 Tax=Minwuia sp. TaxID=2493630 RepID=UPI003A89C919
MNLFDTSAVWSLSEAFLQNLALLVVLTYVFGLISSHLRPASDVVRQLVMGALFAAAAIACMNMPLEPQPGLLLDQRGLMLLFAWPFGGPVAALFAGAATGAYRIYLGGIGMWPGLGAIVATVALGWMMTRWGGGLRTTRSAVIGGLLLCPAILPWFLGVGELSHGFSLMVKYAPAYLVSYVAGSVLLSGLLMIDQRRREAVQRQGETEAKLRDVLDVSTDWFWETDADLRFTYISQSFRNVFSRPVEYYYGKRRSDLATDDNRQEVLIYEDMLRKYEPFVDFRYSLPHADGSRRYVSISGKPVFDEDGNFQGYRGSGREVSDEVKAQIRLEDALLEAEQANRAKTTFLSQMSHELRTPLNAVIGFADLMRREMRGPLGSPEYKRDAEGIFDSGSHLLGLINDLLDLSKIEAGMLALRREECDMAQIVRSSVRMLTPRATAAEITLDTRDVGEHVTARVDERAIKQVTLNLLTNAVKFTPQGGRIAVRLQQTPDGRIELSISDTGCGIAPEEQERIFRPFEQASNARRMAAEGTGLGLAICRALVEAHDGELVLTSQVGEGTTVQVRLPVSANGGQPEKTVHANAA